MKVKDLKVKLNEFSDDMEIVIANLDTSEFEYYGLINNIETKKIDLDEDGQLKSFETYVILSNK